MSQSCVDKTDGPAGKPVAIVTGGATGIGAACSRALADAGFMEKAALDAMTRSLAKELQGRNIRVNSVAPGFIDTEMTASLSPDVRQRILDMIPLGRMGRPEEVAELVAFLARSGGYIHGSVLHVNGGIYGG